MLSFLSLTFMDNLTAIAIIFLCLFCLFLYYDNKKLNKIIDDLKCQNKADYKKNILKEDVVSIEDISKDLKEENIKSAISVEKNEDINFKKTNVLETNDNSINYDKDNIDDVEDKHIKFNIDDFIKKDNIYRKLDSSKMNKDYLAEVSKELSNNMEPQTIKLTDYEQEQEDNAIISYKELLNANNKEEIVNDGTVEFIEELKKFRNNLGK